MDPILENEGQASVPGEGTKSAKSKQKLKKKKNQPFDQAGSQTVVGTRRKFVVTPTVSTTTEVDGAAPSTSRNNAHTIHFGTKGPEPQRRDVRSIFREKPADSSRPSSAERDGVKKEYETFHGTSTSPRSSIFDIFRLRRKSDSKKHQSIMQNVKAALGGTSKSAEAPESVNESKVEDLKGSDKKYYHTVTGASSRKYSPITRVMGMFKKPLADSSPPAADSLNKKNNAKKNRRSSIETTSPTYHKNSYSYWDPSQAKQLFREVRGLPKFDPYLSIVQISIGGRDKARLLLNFFKYHKCHEILPKSSKILLFDTQFLVKKCFPTLISNGIRTAPLWDPIKKQVTGMITVTDFIRILLHLHNENIPLDELEKHTIHTWKKILRPFRKPLCWVDPEQSLHEAINLLHEYRIHRLLMIDSVTGDVLYVLSHKRILRFLFVYLNEFPELTFFYKSVTELKIGTYSDIISVSDGTTIKEAFQLLLDNDISALPILDENGKLLDVYAKYEVLNLVSEKLYTNLSLTLGEVRIKKKDWQEKLQSCRSSITLYEALELIVRTESHRLLLVDKNENLIGIVSLSDILTYLNRVIPVEKKVSSLQEIFRPLEENKVPESARENDVEVYLEVPNAQKNFENTNNEVQDTNIKVDKTEEVESVEINDVTKEDTPKVSDNENIDLKVDEPNSVEGINQETEREKSNSKESIEESDQKSLDVKDESAVPS